MRKQKTIKSVVAMMAAAMTLTQPVAAASWVKNDTGWQWHEDNGSYAANKWNYINGEWYWFDGNGYMVTGWRKIGGIWYWFESNGCMVTGWKKIDGLWYWFDSNGAMATGWREIDGEWFYMESSGAMAADKWIDNYYVNASGVWTKTRTPAKWIAEGDRWWYRHTDGSFTRNGWETINGKDYLFDASGWMLTGWQCVNGTWYYLEASGAKATDKWVGNYYVESDGAMATGKWIGDYYVNDSGLWVETKGNHSWGNYTWFDIKNGYACNWCYKDITDYDDYYDCHTSFHTHTFYNFPSYYKCDNCNALLHRHIWCYKKPTYYENSDEIMSKGYWYCSGCGNQSSDGKQADPILISEEGYEYGSINHWTTPFNFEKDANEWVVEDGEWQPADDRPYLRDISIAGRASMAVGDTYQATVSFTPVNPVEGKDVTWESSDPSVVSVDSNGKITALKIGTATIKATSSNITDTEFIRVTENNVGHVKSAVICIDGQSNPDGALKIKKGNYTLSVQTDPEQAVYEIYYYIKQDKSDGMIAGITGSIRQGNISAFTWQDGISYTDPSTQAGFWAAGTVVVEAKITDKNGDRIEISQEVVIE